MVLGPYFTPTVPSGGAAEEIASGPMMFTGLEGPVIEGVTVSVAVMVHGKIKGRSHIGAGRCGDGKLRRGGGSDRDRT